MKKTITILSFFLATTSFSQQLTEVQLNYVFDVTVPQASHTDSIYIDGDTLVDILLYSWFIYDTVNGYENLGIEVLSKDNDNNFNNSVFRVKNASNSLMIQDCHDFGGGNSSSAYLYTNNPGNVNYTSGYKKVPFRFDASDGNHHGFLYVRYEDSIVTLQGLTWNEIPEELCPCNSDYLGIQNIVEEDKYQEIIGYYNLLGQEINEPKGLVIVLYKSGLTRKMFITN